MTEQIITGASRILGIPRLHPRKGWEGGNIPFGGEYRLRGVGVFVASPSAVYLSLFLFFVSLAPRSDDLLQTILEIRECCSILRLPAFGNEESGLYLGAIAAESSAFKVYTFN
ncbi:hypothetical protein NPIL_557031 [Nephila pilipes]|uniref:Uncharacterized protein n=1 Tax=Nephila pilipes TaxID=299642 RepID=A0A8X6PDX3_NEPPI|nr:hypothetical protein NPIL_557031 [Nephila pilipes]